MTSGNGARARWAAWLDGRGEWLLLVLAVIALLFTFTRPTASLQLPQIEAVVVFDITQSMNVPDERSAGKPATRLAHAKAEVERLLPLLPCGSRLGWGLFTDHRSFLLIEPIEVCEHLRELVGGLRRIDGSMAWEGNSEVAKGLNSGLQMAEALGGGPALVFVSDGHEAPPISPNYRPAFSVPRGKVRGLVLGVGGDVPQPIPRRDPSGNPAGVWQAKDVMQVDPRSLGRAGNGETMAGDGSGASDAGATGGSAASLGATPGAEHLSALREGYLQRLAAEAGLGYQHLKDAGSLYSALADARLSRTVASTTDLRGALAGVALLALWWPTLRRLRWPWRPRLHGALAQEARRQPGQEPRYSARVPAEAARPQR